MATKRTEPVNEETILDAVDYQPIGGGEKATRYEVVDGVLLSLRRVTPELIEEYNSARRKKEDLTDTRSDHAVALDRAKIIAEAPASFDWRGCSMLVIWRIVEDFLSLSAPRLRKRSEFSKESLDV